MPAPPTSRKSVMPLNLGPGRQPVIGVSSAHDAERPVRCRDLELHLVPRTRSPPGAGFFTHRFLGASGSVRQDGCCVVPASSSRIQSRSVRRQLRADRPLTRAALDGPRASWRPACSGSAVEAARSGATGAGPDSGPKVRPWSWHDGVVPRPDSRMYAGRFRGSSPRLTAPARGHEHTATLAQPSGRTRRTALRPGKPAFAASPQRVDTLPILRC